jgi:hypothetical protein
MNMMMIIPYLPESETTPLQICNLREYMYTEHFLFNFPGGYQMTPPIFQAMN